MGFGNRAFEPVQAGWRQVLQYLQGMGLVKAPVAVHHQPGAWAQRLAQRQHAVHTVADAGLAVGCAAQRWCEAIKRRGLEAGEPLSLGAPGGGYKTLWRAQAGGAVDVGVQRHLRALCRPQH